MAKSLVIVESPAKAKTINKYLGSDYIVEASVGHVKDLPKGGLSIDVDAGFVPTYEVIKGKRDVIERLKNLASRAETIFLATDPDREGEAIAWHIAQEIKAKGKKIRRVLFNEITKSGITAAMRQPRDIDRDLVAAQEARRVMDRLIGYKVSPFLWNRFRGESRGLSAGRVQSVALRLVVERERAINSFIPIEYWSLIGHFRTGKGEEITAKLVRYAGEEIRNPSGSATELKEEAKRSFIATRENAERLQSRAMKESYAISHVSKKEVRRSAPPPFTTSTIQQDAGRRLRFSTKKVMDLAQKLYEGVELGAQGLTGLITYMRTDSTRVSEEAVGMAEEFIYENFGKEYLPQGGKGKKTAIKKKGDSTVQDAHEAIRPTNLKITPKEARKHLDRDLAALYELVWNRFVASQMADALFHQTTLDIEGGPFVFRATGRITKFRGWMQVYGDEEEEKEKKEASGTAEVKDAKQKRGKSAKSATPQPDTADPDDDAADRDRILPDVKEGEPLALESVDIRQSFTKPPARYTESLLVKEMEAKGIGRPSTYANIIQTIQDRGYVEQRERKLYATELGMKVCDALVVGFPALFDLKFTAKMEEELDTIAGGKTSYLEVMRKFYRPLTVALGAAGSLAGGGASGGTAEGRLASGKATRKKAKELPSGEGEQPERKRPEKPKGTPTDTRCQKCGAPMELREGNYGPYLACTGFPQCRNIISATPDGKPRQRGSAEPQSAKAAPPPTGITCEQCGAPMLKRSGKNGEFYGCSNYPTCRNTKPVPLGIKCPQCGTGDLAQRVGGRYNSTFYACTRYPECRFTSSGKPLNQPCSNCGNAWTTEGWDQYDGAMIECPKCKARKPKG